jgi:uncharacterized protein
MSQSNRKANHLQGQTSPYLLQHLYNPVDWYPWGTQALEKARTENKPLLISIGYSACHWCHVMEHESFEDEHVAQIMNENFVCIKVDREERPDIDHLYMNAVQLLSERGGWPLNCFALPDARPFWGATYFPKEQWVHVLQQITNLYQNQLHELEEQAEQLTRGIAQSSLLPRGVHKDQFPASTTDNMTGKLLEKIDMKNGGFSGAPKFPLPATLEFLLHYLHQHPQNTKAEKALHVSLHKMALGGIYDQVGGGFSRYSVDDKWKVPHFEKMLYDNAQLLSLYAKAWKVKPEPLYKDVVVEIISFLKRELCSPNGTFYAALDADSEGVEGKYYVWDADEFYDVLADEAPLAAQLFSIGGKGLWEHDQNILLLDTTIEEFAHRENIDQAHLRSRVEKWKQMLYARREERVRPGLDNKIIISWNALTIDALAEAGSCFCNPAWILDAEKTAAFILQYALLPDGSLAHTLHGSNPAIDGFLEDYAFMIKGLIKLGQVTMNEQYFLSARDLLEYTLTHFTTPETNMFAFSSVKGEKLVAPYFDFQDNVIPSANSTMARNLFYLGNIFEEQQWVERSRNMLADLQPQMENYGRWTPNWGILWLHLQKPFYTLAITGEQAGKKTEELMQRYLPDTLVCASSHDDSELPILKNRYQQEKTLIYPCTLSACLQPVEEVDKLLSVI